MNAYSINWKKSFCWTFREFWVAATKPTQIDLSHQLEGALKLVEALVNRVKVLSVWLSHKLRWYREIFVLRTKVFFYWKELRMKKQLSTKYDHKEVETQKYQQWLEKDYFKAKEQDKEPFCIVIPPPNVTGKLHLGHAWDTTLQDIIARFKRMQGYDTLWLSGMDHAGIATQAKIEEALREKGQSRYDLGRETFLDVAWQWKEDYATAIREQWATLGLSLDYSRERFTLDEGLSDAVKKVFVSLYNQGLIFQGDRIINWDPQAKTALSNIEVIHKEVKGALYSFAFRVKETNEILPVATTRPETMFGDVCVFVHPDDERYLHVHGKTVINPANHKEMPILVDDYIDISFGSGAMKCTPAHDPNDFNLSTKHNLEQPICIHPDGSMNELAGEFEGLDRFECRKQLVTRIESEGNLIEIKEHIHQVGHSERTDVIVEPYLSKQWFVKMKPLAEKVLKAQAKTDEAIEFFPPRFNKTFMQWLENIEDWCISRQLWWGHRIPAYFHRETGEVIVSETPPVDIEHYRQDEDVLDTWFSSALWPFSTLGWPDESSDDYQRFYPNSVLVTGYDIIFFWVARMAFMGHHFTDSRPFEDVLIHGLVRDAQGRKMSKSLGNGVDPMDVIEQYGADALRFFLTTNSTPGQDLRYMEEKVEAAWNFINKLWNASRFVLMNLPDDYQPQPQHGEHASFVDQWIIDKLNQTIVTVSDNMEKYEFSMVGHTLVNFIWDDFCSWYIELSKITLSGDDPQATLATQYTLYVVLEAIVKLLHPFMPFVSEEIYQSLTNKESVCISDWPKTMAVCAQDFSQVDQLISMISTIRELRLSKDIKKDVDILACGFDLSEQPIVFNDYIEQVLKRIVNVTLIDDVGTDVLVYPIVSGTLLVKNEGLEDKDKEIDDINKQLLVLQKELKRSEGMLSNASFLKKAKPEKIQQEKEKFQEYQRQYDILKQKLQLLKS